MRNGRYDKLLDLRAQSVDEPDHVLIIAEHREAIILVRNRRRGRWELPGGLLEPGEDALTRACIEFFEETGQRPTNMRRCAMATIQDGLTRRATLGAVYVCTVLKLQPFRHNIETAGIRLWRGEDAEGIDRAAIDVIRRCRRYSMSSATA